MMEKVITIFNWNQLIFIDSSININMFIYRLINTGEGSTENGNNVVISGKVNLASDGKSLDKRLQITVIPEAPCLQASNILVKGYFGSFSN